MTITAQQIEDMFATLKALLDQILPLRTQVDVLVKDLALAQRDYDQLLGELNREAERLHARIADLQQRLAAPTVAPSPVSPDPLPDLVTPPPPTVQPSAPVELTTPIEPLLLPEDPRFKRKRSLADHIEWFREPSQQAEMQVINAVLSDEGCDMGDMLELLNWGPIWMARAEWETIADQHHRLNEWQMALEERLAYWQNRLHALEQDARYPLWQKMSSSSAEWPAYLRELADQQTAENTRLERTVAILTAELQTGKESDDG